MTSCDSIDNVYAEIFTNLWKAYFKELTKEHQSHIKLQNEMCDKILDELISTKQQIEDKNIKL